ncbi:MAG TPA: M20/M25/M40 family metallo-hydrolase [Solirubrobacteraceae bacterium]|nr:M20/M25/M40 family metallo-hydrolase [Solirubrobacteraceae bacterium]
MASDLQAQTTEVLQRLVRFNTVNPPGGEREAQEYLADYLGDAGLDCELLGALEDRPNLIARLPGKADGPTLCYLGHVDTVLADADDWSVDPWSGHIVDGFLYGRGALDMKSQVAAEAVAVAELARSGWRPARGELLLLCVVDEETGGANGAQWLTQQHPDKVRCDMVLNEGAGAPFDYDGRRYRGVCCAEKGIFRFTITTDGVAGHASMPRLGDNALLKMAPLLERFSTTQPSFDVPEEARALLQGIGEPLDADVAGLLERLREADPMIALMLEPMLGVSMTPTRIRASEKVNVIPAQAHLQVDCRVPPGRELEDVLPRIEEVLGPANGYRVSFDECVSGNRSPAETPLMQEIGRWTAEHDPGSSVVPTLLPGFSDSRWFRAAFPDCVAYGFFPQRHMTLYEAMPLIHSADERIDVRDLGFATTFYRDLAERILGNAAE